MTISPSTDLYLLKLPIELDSSNQLTFSSKQEQASYFLSLQKIGETDFTYQRREGIVRYPAEIDSIIEYNYVMYRNENYSDKWFYAYITNMTYINDGMTAIEILEDPFQTWQFDLNFNPCFVEREHVNDDTVGLHTIDEGIGTGEYIFHGINSVSFPESCICFQVTERPNGAYSISPDSKIYNSTYSGLTLLTVENAQNADVLLEYYQRAGKGDAIVSIFVAPKAWSTEFFLHTLTVSDPQWSGNIYIGVMKESNGLNTLSNIDVSKPTKLGSYTPVNKKLLCYPFSMFTISNNNGAVVDYRYEDFSGSDKCSFNVQGAVGQGCQIKALPMQYKGEIQSIFNIQAQDYGINAGKLPLCGWKSDFFLNYMTQNAANIGVGMASSFVNAGTSLLGGIGQAVGGTIAGNPVGGALSGIGTAVSGITGVMSQFANLERAKIMPDQAKGNTGCSDFNYAMHDMFTVYQQCLRPEFAEIIDKYLSVFGYKVNELKSPNIRGRRNWNYVKTSGCNIHAYIPQEATDRIKEMFDKGITLWHNPATFLDYSQSNPIV